MSPSTLAADRAFAFVENGPLKTWNWEGQFEDVEPTERFVNLTKHDACSTAMYLLERFPGDASRIAQARQIAMYLIREQTQLSTTRIGDLFGGRDHTTVMHACDKIAQLSEKDEEIRRAVRHLLK